MPLEKVYANPHITHNIAIGDTDYVQNGNLVIGSRPSSIMVTSQSDLSSLTDCIPGSIAFTAGFADMWQLNAAGTWVPLGGE